MGAVVVDIIVIAILVISSLVAYIRGLGSVIYQIASWIITVILLFVLCTPITNFIIEKTTFDETISSKIEENLIENFGNELEDGDEINEEDSSISTSVINLINNYINEAKEKEIENIAEYVANEISYIVVSAVVILGLFIFARFVSILIKFVIEVIVSLPILNTFNKIGGIIFGVIRGLVVVYIILAIFSLLSPALDGTGIISLIKSSNIASIFYNDNVILNFLIK